VIDCNDARAQFRVQEMIGSCAMPRAQVGPHPDEARRERRSFAAAPTPDRAPPSRAQAAGDWIPPLIAHAAGLAPPRFATTPFAADTLSRLRSRPGDRIDRPPRA
jgi:hypothetical protein